MPKQVTNQDLMQTVYAGIHRAADDVSPMMPMASLAQITHIRNLLREAYCAAQELKTRMKQQTKGKT